MNNNTSSTPETILSQYGFQSSSVANPFVLVSQAELQETGRKLDHIENFNQRVIVQLTKAHSVLYTINILWRVLLFLFAMILGVAVYLFLHNLELINKYWATCISIPGLILGIIMFVLLIKKIPNDLKELKDKIIDLECKYVGFDGKIKNIESQINDIQQQISSK